MLVARGAPLAIWRTISFGRGIPRQFSHDSHLAAKPLPPRIIIHDADIEESFLKGSGPGGQKINKTNSAVQLKHLPSGLVIKCQETRSRTQNRKIARRLLSDRLEEIEKGEKSRTALKRQALAKKKASKAKKSRRKYRKLDEEKRSALGGIVDESGGSDEPGCLSEVESGHIGAKSQDFKPPQDEDSHEESPHSSERST